ncbi:Rpn family recombination-promoting nuclease/putative transposase [Natroniella sulfidigena]|uniref:Rpn family recombination-promoting nuclease/putative transposase n=1 Tax=Natroniella sulfidigena TaxID=723921 RepID=UPI00200A12F1|nr:Rpn family recombination-promoting nuclease/putative transposase [Natroniella sulfidigena]MCK8816769.1 Rpn family recombination-promoting nuclease/putative transposase [Natroniella sulfidigena]
MRKDILDPKVDFVFKQIFGSEKHPEILISFLNSVFATKGTKKEIVQVEIDNSDLEKDWEDDKYSRLDIKATANDETRINIEIQLKNQYNMKRRTLYYWSKLFESQIKEGEAYEELQKTVTINILNFNYLKMNERYHNTYILKEKETNEILTNLQEIHFIELPKLNEEQFEDIGKIESKRKEDNLIPWVLFLKNPDSEVIKMLEERIEELQEAAEVLEVLSHDEETREIYERRQKAIHDEISNITGAIKEVAMNLLELDVDIETIVKATGLSEEKVKKLKSQIDE